MKGKIAFLLFMSSAMALWLARRPQSVQTAPAPTVPTHVAGLPAPSLQRSPHRVASVPVAAASPSAFVPFLPLPHHVPIQILPDQTVVAHGDIDLGMLPEEYRGRVSDRSQLRISETKEWPRSPAEKTFTLAFVFSDALRTTAPQLMSAVRQAAEVFRRETPVAFDEFKASAADAPPPAHGVVFEVLPETQSKLCLSRLGHQGGWQPIRLGSECGVSEILHEMLHTLGFVHEHTRPESTDWVEPLWSAIAPEHQLQFQPAPQEWLRVYERLGEVGAFDPTSIMMYRLDSFSRGGPTLKWTHPTPYVPPSQTLSPQDIARVRALYSR